MASKYLLVRPQGHVGSNEVWQGSKYGRKTGTFESVQLTPRFCWDFWLGMHGSPAREWVAWVYIVTDILANQGVVSLELTSGMNNHTHE